jgi:hypothetical protein
MKFTIEASIDVFTSDGKKIGKAHKIERDYLIVYKSGLLTDEQFRIPTSAIVDDNGNISHRSIRLDLTEEQLKHGYEFLEAKTNSEFMHGRKESERKIRLEKQVIQFEPIMSTMRTIALRGGHRPYQSQKDIVIRYQVNIAVTCVLPNLTRPIYCKNIVRKFIKGQQISSRKA